MGKRTGLLPNCLPLRRLLPKPKGLVTRRYRGRATGKTTAEMRGSLSTTLAPGELSHVRNGGGRLRSVAKLAAHHKDAEEETEAYGDR